MVTLKMDEKKHPLIFILHPRYVETISDKKIGVLLNVLSPLYVAFIQSHVIHQRRVTTSQKTNGNSLPEQHKPQHTTSNLKKQWHHDPPLLAGLQWLQFLR